MRELRTKGRHYTEAEKLWLLDKHLEILRQIIPLHKELSDRGRGHWLALTGFDPAQTTDLYSTRVNSHIFEALLGQIYLVTVVSVLVGNLGRFTRPDRGAGQD